MNQPQLILADPSCLSAVKPYVDAVGASLFVADDWKTLTEAMNDRPERDVLVAAGKDVAVWELAELVTLATNRRKHIGFVAGWAGEESIRLQVRKLLEPVTARREGTLLCSEFSFAGIAPRSHPDLTVLALEDPALVTAVGEGYELVGLVSHGSGADSPFGEAVLCTLADGNARDTDDPWFLPCGHDADKCVRRRRTGDGWVTPERVGAAMFAAGTMVWQTCTGVPPHGSTFPPAATLGQRMLENPRVGSLLTTFQIVDADDSMLLYATALLRRGHTLGETCMRLNAATLNSTGDTPWILLGNPAKRLGDPATGQDRDRERERPEGARPAGSTPTPPTLTPLTLTPGLVDTARGSGSPGDDLLIVRPTTDTAIASDDLRLGHVRGSDDYVLLHTGPRPVEVVVEAYPDHALPDQAKAVLSIWGSARRLQFSTRLLAMLERHPKAAQMRDLPATRAAAERLLEYYLPAHATTVRKKTLLNGTARGLDDRCAYEVGQWLALQRGLVSVAGDMCRFATSRIDEFYLRESLPGPYERDAAPCHYCENKVIGARFDLPGFGHIGRSQMECHRCERVLDASTACRDAWLAGPDLLKRGTTYSFDLRARLAEPVRGFQFFAAGLAFRRWSWGDPPEAPVEEFVLGEGGTEIEDVTLEVDVPRHMPVGAHTVCAAIAAHGDVWIVTKPVAVVA
ncbi:hypothetical protein ACLQ2R_29730 [Streptosporangium sp. DT93]|uniref:hypothetical protein n=1 Tax=Streptosporangium sp. DT93 TaxID=3393428 RepID=UPI003CF885B8